MFLLVVAHPGCPSQSPESSETVVCVCVMLDYTLIASKKINMDV